MKIILIALTLATSCLPRTPQTPATLAESTFVGDEERAKFLAMLPPLSDGLDQELRNNYRIEFYNDQSLEQVMQHLGMGRLTKNGYTRYGRGNERKSGLRQLTPPTPSRAYAPSQRKSGPLEGTPGLFDITSDFNGDGDPVGNPNNEFPWLRSAATDFAHDDVESFKFVAIPKGSSIVFGLQDIGAGSVNMLPVHMTWEFPDRTIAGEVMMLSKVDLPFEVRISKKQGNKWFFRAYRPFAKIDELKAALPAAVAAQIGQKIKSDTLKNYISQDRLSRSFLASQALSPSATSYDISAIPCELVPQLLKRSFVPVNGRAFYREGTIIGHAPYSESDCGIVPKRYLGHFLEVSRSSCMGCHQTTLGDALYFNEGRFWYGRVRGSDHVFSFHIFDPKFIQPGSMATQPFDYEQMVDQKLISSGLIKPGQPGPVYFTGYGT